MGLCLTPSGLGKRNDPYLLLRTNRLLPKEVAPRYLVGNVCSLGTNLGFKNRVFKTKIALLSWFVRSTNFGFSLRGKLYNKLPLLFRQRLLGFVKKEGRTFVINFALAHWSLPMSKDRAPFA
jgi:hypothetical protein